MNDFDSIALRELRGFVSGARDDFLVALDGHERVREPERDQQLLHGRARLDLAFFTVDHEAHRPGA